MRPSRSLDLLPLSALLASACGGDSPPASEEQAASVAAEPRVRLSPTADDQLPSAIIGEAGPLMGVDVHYVEGDPLPTGYLAVPEGDGPFPALIIIHEWNGLVDRVRQVADNFAAEGYVTLAADVYDGRTGSNRDENVALMSEVRDNPERMIANLDAAVSFLRARDDVTGKVGAMGWCFGGGVALSFGLDGDHHEATAIFYGQLVDDPERLAHIDHEVYGTFAELDQGIPPEAVANFEDALRAVGIENDLHVYDEVNHGFWLRVDGAPEVRTGPALDAWQRLKAYLDRTVGSGG